jgi:predicted transcriptional regulator/GNAT superfamily N-acetyltransferase/predicted nucleic acid-binding protein
MRQTDEVDEGGIDPDNPLWPVRFRTPRAADPLFAEVFKLGESQTRFVGMLPHQAWREYADSQRILAAVIESSDRLNEERLLGYAAFRLPRNEVVLAHLVVSEPARGRGIARLLIEQLTLRFADRRGIAAQCRRDFRSNAMWPHLNFVALGERPGRSIKGHLLTYWWKDHGHEDLMSWQGATPSEVSVAMDMNVFLDLHGRMATERALATRELFDQQLEGRVQLLVTPELFNEIDRQQDPVDRERLRRRARLYPRLAISPTSLDIARESLRSEMAWTPSRPQDVSDLEHVAYAIAAGVQVVATRDSQARRRLSSAARDLAGVEVVSPSELPTLIDKAEDAPAYWPVSLLGTGYSVREATAADYDSLRGFLNTALGERRQDFDRAVERLAELRARAHRLLYHSPDNEPVALLGAGMNGSVLEAKLLRLQPSALQASLAAQLVGRIRDMAGELSATAIRVTDPNPHVDIAKALLADGYRPAGDHLVAMTSQEVCLIADLSTVIERCAVGLADHERTALEPVTQAAAEIEAGTALVSLVASLERQLRPLRIADATLDTWLVPIKPGFASQLFNAPAQLFDRSAQLGISIEHVYYKGSSAGETAPGRVLWYVSKPLKAIIGCSDLIEVIDDEPDALYRRFRRLGVYRREQLRKTAKGRATVRALHVVNTEVFAWPVPLSRLENLAARNCQRVVLVSASRIDRGLFTDILKEGRHGRTAP